MTRSVLSEDLLERCARRAADYDRENRFFSEDFEELREAKYLLAAVPEEFAGLGLTLAQICQEQRRLARRSAPTALAVNMHLLATGVAADLWRRGDGSQVWILEEAARGAVFAYGHSESGNDLEVLYASGRAERVDGGYRFFGHKHFGTLSPVWDWLNIYGMDQSDPEHPRIVHAVIPRDAAGYRIVETWDTLGMRATQSHDTLIEGVFVPDRHVIRVRGPGFAGADEFVLTLFGWAEPTFANIYIGLAERARDLAIARVKTKSSVADMTRSMAYHPEVQHTIADIVILVEAIIPHAERIAEDWTNGVDHGAMWPAKLVAAKYHCVEGAFRAVDLAMDVSGGRGMFRDDELERLYRDARCGRFHPANAMVVHEVIGKSALGVLGEAGPRWG
ncbi:MAG: acyl-CoA/acyl-ACP dehydrogenase [Alphaproteobacteria bacterium]|nr:acyl-CoA/acyl-ACP dehydrogenase [Alphaproteobacteria bacterium]